MSIRDQVRRALRKSSASARTHATGTTASPVSSNTSQSSDSTSSLHKTTSMLSRAFTWGGRDKEEEYKAPRKPQKKGGKRTVHPSEKPLTAENLRHQELLSHFTMTFGASDPSRLDSLSFVGVSPCCTRRPSIDGDFTTTTEASSRYDLPSTYDDDMVPP